MLGFGLECLERVWYALFRLVGVVRMVEAALEPKPNCVDEVGGRVTLTVLDGGIL